MNFKGTLFIITLIVIAFACDNKISSEEGILITHTLCKNEKDLKFETNETCIEYSYNEETKVLSLKHINTAFNCCPDKLYCEINIENDTIIIEEFERKQECNCLCLYDMEVEAYNIEKQIYTLKYIEPYSGTQNELIFEINLSENISGNYCTERSKYPWGL